jgi:hypothetical protein
MRKEVKKILGIVLALALVLTMGLVTAAPVGAGLQPIVVTMDVAVTGAEAIYSIIFTPDVALDGIVDTIDITLPFGTTLGGAFAAADVYVGPVGGPYCNPAAITVTPGPLGTTISFVACVACPANVPVEVVLGSAPKTGVLATSHQVWNPDPCEHTLRLGTSWETAQESTPYLIYMIKICLTKGWNLISLPGIPEDPDIEVVLQDLIIFQTYEDPTFVFKVYYYDCATWYAFNNGAYASLTEMTECKAYWIWVNKAICFHVHGTFYPPPPGPPLKKCYHECWNMVGFTSDVPREPFVNTGAACGVGLSAYIESLAPSGTVIYILGWDATVQDWDPVVQGTDCLVPGQGYWMSFSMDACFTPPPPGT